MKYIKTYEEVNISIADFVNTVYWRFQNNRIDSIMKVIKISYDKYHIYSLDLDNGKLDKLDWFDDYMIRTLLNQENLNLRPATAEEIEQFKISIDALRYNL